MSVTFAARDLERRLVEVDTQRCVAGCLSLRADVGAELLQALRLPPDGALAPHELRRAVLRLRNGSRAPRDAELLAALDDFEQYACAAGLAGAQLIRWP